MASSSGPQHEPENNTSTSASPAPQKADDLEIGIAPTRQDLTFMATLKVTLLGDEWNSSAGGLSTLNRELAIHLSKHPKVQVTLLVPEGACKDEEKRAAQSYGITIAEAKERPGYSRLDWLSFPPEDLSIDVIVGHGVKLGRQGQVISDSNNCKWVQVVHTAPEDLSKYKSYADSISKGEKKHQDEVDLCKLADLVVPVGPRLEQFYSSYLRRCKNDQDIFSVTPGLFDREFGDLTQAPQKNTDFRVLIFGRGDDEDFELKGYNIAAEAFTDYRLKEKPYHLIFVGAPDGKQEEVRQKLLQCGIAEEQLTVRKFIQSRDRMKDLFCEADLAIMPSKSEGFGLVALEALSACLPILVGRKSGFASALNNVPFGKPCIVDSDEPAKWAEAIEAVRARHELWLEEIKELRASYEKKYSWKEQCEALVVRMREMINGVVITHSYQDLVSDEQEATVRGFLIRQVQVYITNHKVSTAEGLGALIEHLIKAHNLALQSVGVGSLKIKVHCPTLESLESLWNDYCSGHLNEVAERYLVTDEIKRKINQETVRLNTTIEEGNYLICKKALMKKSRAACITGFPSKQPESRQTEYVFGTDTGEVRSTGFPSEHIEPVQGVDSVFLKDDKREKPEEPDKLEEPSKSQGPGESDKPQEPSEPQEPGKPGKPGKPDKPQEPSKPQGPGKPGKPGEPGEPDKPQEPSKPQGPVEPDKPDKPGESDKPLELWEPDKPGEPDKPQGPDKPDKPQEPGEPDKPQEPGEPDKPQEPGKPDKPDKPQEPGKPDKPQEPGELDKPDKPQEPEEPDKPQELGEPVKPDKPQEPEEPEEPDKPQELGEPDKPGELDKPQEPGEPDNPQEVGEPDKPQEAGEPDKPQEAGEPDKPQEAGEPDKPEEPAHQRVNVGDAPPWTTSGKKMWLPVGVAACAAGAAGVVAAPLLAGAALGAVGFTGAGVAAGSVAAAVQSSIGYVAGGSFFAACQSAAATGVIGSAATAAIGGSTGLAGIAATLGGLKLFGKGSDTLKLVICGSGNGAHVFAGIASSLEGTDVRVLSYQEEAERWSNAMQTEDLEVTFHKKGKESSRIVSKPAALVTKNPEDAMRDADMVVFMLQASCYQVYLEALKLHIKPGTIIVGLPGHPGFEFHVRHVLGDTCRQCTIINFESSPWACRATGVSEFGVKCEVLGTMETLLGAIKTGDVKPKNDPIATLQYLLGPVLKVMVSGHQLGVQLMSVNAYLHPSILYGQWEGWDGTPLDQPPLFYNGVTESTANLLSNMSEEIVNIAKLLELKTEADMSKVMHIYKWFMRCYPEDISDKTNLYTAIQTNAAYQGLKHPVKKTDDGKFLPDFTHRYMTEDIPYGLVVIRGIAEIVGVETPNIDKVLTWCQEKMGKEYLVSSKLQGKDIATTRAPQRYGFTTLESIL